jgi:hypothetical protein
LDIVGAARSRERGRRKRGKEEREKERKEDGKI